MTGYTKGPWTVDPCWDILGNTNDGNGLVCAVTHDAVPREEAEANARLIAAAPEMHEALKMAWRAVYHLCGPDSEELAKVDAALAKAEGKA